MGFGHRVYKSGDVRAGILKQYARRAAEAAGASHWEETAEIVEKVLAEEKNLFPNLDWPSGRLYYALGLEVPLYTPIFVMSLLGYVFRAQESSTVHVALVNEDRPPAEQPRLSDAVGELLLYFQALDNSLWQLPVSVVRNQMVPAKVNSLRGELRQICRRF